MRGKVARIQINPRSKLNSFSPNQAYDGINSRKAQGACHPPRNNVTPKPLSAHMPKYSAMKKSAYLKPEYSVKCPATSSLSASGKSKGERLDSARAEIRKMTKPAKPHGVKTCQWGRMPAVQPP